MTIATGLARLRALLNEPTEQFWTDTILYSYLDMAQNLITDALIQKTYELRRTRSDDYRSQTLEGLVATDSTNTTITGTREYSLPTNFLMTDHCSYVADERTYSVVPAKLEPYNTVIWKEQNPFMAPSIPFPSYYIRGSKIGFSPVPVHGTANGYLHYYYMKPLLASSDNSASEFSLNHTAHEPIVIVAYAFALRQDARIQESDAQMQLALSIIKTLE